MDLEVQEVLADLEVWVGPVGLKGLEVRVGREVQVAPH